MVHFATILAKSRLNERFILYKAKTVPEV